MCFAMRDPAVLPFITSPPCGALAEYKRAEGRFSSARQALAVACLSYAVCMRSLSGAFSIDRMDQSDLQQIIQRHFPNASQPARCEVIYPGDLARPAGESPSRRPRQWSCLRGSAAANYLASRDSRWRSKYLHSILELVRSCLLKDECDVQPCWKKIDPVLLPKRNRRRNRQKQ